jgi:RNA polymerase sigma-70 factor (ECF subfamily)
VLKNIRHVEKAEDIVQDVFVKVWVKVDDVPFEKAKSYLFQAAYNTMVDAIRKDKKLEFQDEIHLGGSTHQPDLGFKEALDMALNYLPQIQKSAVLLRDYEGYTYEEIAEITGLSDAQVKVYIYRARVALKAYLVSIDYVI